MVDAEVVERRVREIGRRLAALRSLRAAGRAGFDTDPGVRAQVERHLQVAVQCAIDLAFHILADESDRTPEDYGSAFVLLAEAGVVPADLADRLRLAAGLRNLLVHAYLDVDPDRLWDTLEHLEDLDDFARRVVDHLDAR